MVSNDFHPYPIASDDDTRAGRMAAAIVETAGGRQFYETATGPRCSPAAVAAIARAVSRDYADTGYTMTLAGGNAALAVARIEHFDGSRFLLVADRYENVRRVPEP